LEIKVNDLGNQFKGAHVIADTHYELGNKIMKRFGHEKKMVFILQLLKHKDEKRKSL
jgi:hypothetical protein